MNADVVALQAKVASLQALVMSLATRLAAQEAKADKMHTSIATLSRAVGHARSHD